MKICFEILFKPAMSTMDGIINISEVPTYWEMSPEVIVDTITLGIPIGNSFIPAVAIAVPLDPPNDITPSNFCASNNFNNSDCIPLANISVAYALSDFLINSVMSTSTSSKTC